MRWLLLAGAWALMTFLVVQHTSAMRDYVALLDSLGLRGAAEATTRLTRPMPTLFADTQTWVRHALALQETEALRIRHTDIDNAPFGREVHWSSAFAWLLVGAGWLQHAITGEPMPLAMERALAWINAPLLLGVMVFFSWWTARRAGAAAGVFVAFAIVGMSDLNNGFTPNFYDHHGVLSLANFGVVLGALFMGAGWWAGSSRASALLPASREAARRGALFSAISGAVGIGISAASVLPAVAITGAAGLVATIWKGRALRSAGAEFDGNLWRLWGRVGAIACVVFYLLEYAPQHLGLRLEVNHPLFALAWWGGGELVAHLCERHLRIWRVPSVWRVALATAAVLAPLVVILVGGTKVFIVRDPLIHALSARVAEGLSLPRAVQFLGWRILGERTLWAAAALLPLAYLLVRGRRVDRLPLAFAGLTCVAFLAMGFYQVRFFANAGGAQVCAMLIGLAALTQSMDLRKRRWVVLALAALLLLPLRITRELKSRVASGSRVVAKLDALQPLYRDIAAQLRADRPNGEIILLTNPDASTAIGYYGRLKTIGTLYWENIEGVRAAAQMSASTSFPQARSLFQARGVTHVAVISENSFVQEYFELMHPGAKPEAFTASLAYQLFSRQNVPMWLEEVAYTPPADIPIQELRVVIYRTRFAAPAAEALLAESRAHVQAKDLAAAERAIDAALAIDQSNAEIWILKCELLLARDAGPATLRAAEQAFATAPEAHRAGVAADLGNVFYQKGSHRTAIELFRASLAQRYDPTVAANLAWVLATTPDPALRNGQSALELGQRVATENPNSISFVSALAAALAEVGQFEAAVSNAARAVELARTTGNPALIERTTARLKVYQAGQPWRQ